MKRQSLQCGIYIKLAVILVVIEATFSVTYSQTDLLFTSITVIDTQSPVISWTATYKNQGDVSADGTSGVRIRFFIVVPGSFSQDIASHRKPAGLEIGKSYTGNYSTDLTGILNIGKNYFYKLRAMVDPDDKYFETDEYNNSLDTTANVVITDPSLIPQITSFTPGNKPVKTNVIVTESNFGDTKGTDKIKFNTVNRYVVSWSKTSIVVRPGNVNPGNFSISVENWNEIGSSSTPFTVDEITVVDLTCKRAADRRKLPDKIRCR